MSLLTALPTPNVWASRTQQASGSPGTQLAGLHSTSDRGPRARRPPGVEARPPTAAPPSTPSAGTGSPGRPRLRPTGYTRRVPATPSSENSGSTWLTHPFIGKRRTARDGGGRRGPGGPRAPEPLSPWSLGRVTLPACGPVPDPEALGTPLRRVFTGLPPGTTVGSLAPREPLEPRPLCAAWRLGAGLNGPPSRHVAGSPGQPARASQGYASAQTQARRGSCRGSQEAPRACVTREAPGVSGAVRQEPGDRPALG